MLGSIGLPELIFIMVLALLIFGPKRLPEIGRTIGKGLSEFRRASNDLKRTIDTEILAADDERRLPSAMPLPPTARVARQTEVKPEPVPEPVLEPAAEPPSGPSAESSGEPSAESSAGPAPEPARD